ncbi:MAG: serine/threonine-protein kinase, partial [Gemmatimonadaceae bacterium]
MTDPHTPPQKPDAVTTPVGITTICPQCGASLDAVTTSCGRCGAVITGGGPGGERMERMIARLQSQIGPQFQLQGLIGRGGMGIVFKAREVTLEREVALKVLAFDPIMNPEAFERFEREARLAARLDHPNIVPIFSVGQGEGAAYYTMRFVRGGSLEALLAAEGQFTLDHAVKLLRDVASALDFAHAQGVVHRDIKPANILLSDSGHALVADFGIARAFAGDAVTSASGSQTGVVGSPAYMAPEQWRGERPDGRADQYALGVLAFELLTGRRPFSEASMQELLRKHLDTDPPSLDTVRKGLPPHVSRSIQRAMAKDPADRFRSTTAFVDALAGEAAVGPLKSARHVFQSEQRRQWFGNVFAALLVMTAVAVGGYAWWLSRQKPAVPAVPLAAAAGAAAAPDTLAARLARELEETRRIALDAERRAERAEASQRAAAVPSAAGASSRTAGQVVGHVGVTVRGGTPRLLVDGQVMAGSTPAIIDVPPGRHVVRVDETGRIYLPRQYVIDVAAGDTSRLLFSDQRNMTREFQQLQQLQQRYPRGGQRVPGAAGAT